MPPLHPLELILSFALAALFCSLRLGIACCVSTSTLSASAHHRIPPSSQSTLAISIFFFFLSSFIPYVVRGRVYGSERLPMPLVGLLFPLPKVKEKPSISIHILYFVVREFRAFF